jgi:hypothetical protein
MTQILSEIFQRDIKRAIEGVIKADDESGLLIELDEYVLTNEIEKQLERFIDAYVNYATANGVWISGFFGSGKSHLLKMLAIVLENRSVDGTNAYDIFAGKVIDNATLSADLRRAAAIPSRSILFNIDQKADVISKGEIDALLSVFQKVFDEMCGYFGKQPYIAQFERDLDTRGVFDAFKAAYKSISGKDWTRGREEVMFEGVNISKALVESAGASIGDADGMLGNYRKTYKSSIEDFAELINKWLEAQPKGFRLNFFVDEVGQFIADNVKLMTNLQTIAESLNTKCRGRAWIIVTSQQDIENVIGEVTKQQQNDFSKIQARFACRLPLNSQDVAEVIQRRLLAKNRDGENVLADLYQKEAGNLKTLFDFTDNSIRLQNFRDQDHFVASYPFVPYQFPLFQQAIQNLSGQNAFEGRHSSVGERSMLAVFQDVGKILANEPIGRLATFDQMFEGIRKTLKSQAQTSISLAENNLDDAFALRVLKSLFLVKYVKQFKATSRNIAILMQDRFDLDLADHRRKVEQALAVLEQQTYIHRMGDEFAYLTDDEKDVEQEIKQIEIDNSEITKDLHDLLFSHAMKAGKVTHERSKQSFGFAQKVDGQLMNRDHELKIDLLTPFNLEPSNDSTHAMRTVESDMMLIVLPQDERFRAEILSWKKTDKYVRQNRTQRQANVQRIIDDKGALNGARRRQLETRARELLGEARMWVRGEEIEAGGSDPVTRVHKAFQSLVDKVYTNLQMLRGEQYGENDIARLHGQGRNTLEGLGDIAPKEEEQELLNLVRTTANQGLRSTVKTLVERFTVKPYGWSEMAVLGLAAGLLGRGKLEASLDGAPLEGGPLVSALRNNQKHANIVLEQQVEFTPGQVQKLTRFYEDLFGKAPEARDARGLADEAVAGLKALRGEVTELARKEVHYPFLISLEELSAALITLMNKERDWYVTDLPTAGQALIDIKLKTLDPMNTFLNGQQSKIYDEARAFLASSTSLVAELDRHKLQGLKEALADPTIYRTGAAARLRPALDALKTDLDARRRAMQTAIEAELLGLRADLMALPEWGAVPSHRQAQILARFDAAAQPIKSEQNPDLVRARFTQFKDGAYLTLLTDAASEGAPPPPPAPEPAPKPAGDTTGVQEPIMDAPIAPAVARFVSLQAVSIDFGKSMLNDEADVDAYVSTLRGSLMAEVKAGKRIKV